MAPVSGPHSCLKMVPLLMGPLWCSVDINKVMLSKDFLLRMDRSSLQGNHCASSRLLEVRRVNQIV